MSTTSPIIEIREGITANPDYRMEAPVNLRIEQGEQIAIAGNNAAGKSRLVDILTGRHALIGNAIHYNFSLSTLPLVSDNIKYIAFRDSYGEHDNSYFLQQRWNQMEIDDDMPTVGSLLDKTLSLRGASPECIALRDRLCCLFGIDALLDRSIISLSSGELRKFQLIRTLLNMPRVVIIDNPYIGLDASTRKELTCVLRQLTQTLSLLFILVVSSSCDIPDFITHVIPVEDLHVLPKQTRAQYLQTHSTESLPHSIAVEKLMQQIPFKDLSSIPFYPREGGTILKLQDITVRYGSHTLLHHLNWTVDEGERWALYGKNGSGKSTLLSLICADNPQGYACDIELFGHKRGSGESIWDIKRHIGYVSPEMHRAYRTDIPAVSIVASGFYDTVGLYTRPRPEEMDICLKWMEIFGIRHLAERTFLRLSSGEQRLCLLARAFVKDPELLILDEPLHGLDASRRALVRDVIEAFCLRPHKTLIMVSHYLEELPPCINHRLFLKKD
ncbi:MAG: ATP-binding cassette domain-containing protein [Bacteroidaceae bacterium]|nr:ATP-binding cassette domain-containing protein [Bacteroidaceae bacterium]